MYEYKAKIERVIDGDTYVVFIDCGFNLYWRGHLRLLGVNCAEMSTEQGKLTKSYLERFFEINGKDVTIRTFEFDSFGRILAAVQVGNIDLSTHLLVTKYAEPFLGKHTLKASGPA